MIEYLPALIAAWAVQLMGVLSPGPSVALLMSVAMSQGRGAAMITALGIGCASIVLSLATVLGIAILFAQMADLMTIVRIIGAGYLAWLAYGAFRKAIAPPELAPIGVVKGKAFKLGLKGFFLQVSNPKALFFWLAIASLGGLDTAPWPVIALFVIGAFVNSTAGHGLWGFVLSSHPIRAAYLRTRRVIEGALGVFFAAFAMKLALDRS